MPVFILLLLLPVAVAGCGEPEAKIEIPEHVAAMENLTILDPEASSVDSLVLVQDHWYGSSDSVIVGQINRIAVDDRGRVYAAEGVTGKGTVYVYEPDGTYLTNVGRYGRGPGDLLDVVDMQIHGNHLHLYNGTFGGQQITVFSLDDLDYVKTVLLQRNGMRTVENLAGKYPGNRLFITDKGYLMSYREYHPARKPEQIRYDSFFYYSFDGSFVPGILFEIREDDFFYPEYAELPMGLRMQFISRSLIDVSDSGYVYTAWSDEFLIRVRDQNGRYLRAYYYPFSNSTLTMEELDVSERFIRETAPGQLPEAWPALESIFVDEHDRLWILSFSESDTWFGGMVVGKKGEVLGVFRWPGNKQELLKPVRLLEVRNGYLYARVIDDATGLYNVSRFAVRTADGDRF